MSNVKGPERPWPGTRPGLVRRFLKRSFRLMRAILAASFAIAPGFPPPPPPPPTPTEQHETGAKGHEEI